MTSKVELENNLKHIGSKYIICITLVVISLCVLTLQVGCNEITIITVKMLSWVICMQNNYNFNKNLFNASICVCVIIGIVIKRVDESCNGNKFWTIKSLMEFRVMGFDGFLRLSVFRKKKLGYKELFGALKRNFSSIKSILDTTLGSFMNTLLKN